MKNHQKIKHKINVNKQTNDMTLQGVKPKKFIEIEKKKTRLTNENDDTWT